MNIIKKNGGKIRILLYNHFEKIFVTFDRREGILMVLFFIIHTNTMNNKH